MTLTKGVSNLSSQLLDPTVVVVEPRSGLDPEVSGVNEVSNLSRRRLGDIQLREELLD